MQDLKRCNVLRLCEIIVEKGNGSKWVKQRPQMVLLQTIQNARVTKISHQSDGVFPEHSFPI